MTINREHYYCDLCGREVFSRQDFRVINGISMKEDRKIIMCRVNKEAPNDCLDVCKTCAKLIREAIDESISRKEMVVKND